MTILGGRHDTSFPFDDPQTVHEALRRARQELNHVAAGVSALEDLYGVARPEPPAPECDHTPRELARLVAMAGLRDLAYSIEAELDAQDGITEELAKAKASPLAAIGADIAAADRASGAALLERARTAQEARWHAVEHIARPADFAAPRPDAPPRGKSWKDK